MGIFNRSNGAARTNTGIVEAINAIQAMIEFKLDGTIIAANNNFYETMGYTAEDIIGKNHSMFVSEEYKASADYKEFWAKLNNGETVPGLFERLDKSGNTVWLRAAYNCITDSSGKPVKIVKIARDVTKTIEQRNVSLFKGTAFDESSIAMMVVDRDLIVTFVNKSTLDLFSDHEDDFQAVFPEFDPNAIVGTCIDIFHKHPEHQRALLADPSKMPFRTDISVGELKFSLSVSMVLDAQGNHVGNSLEWDHVTQARTNSGIMDALDRDLAFIEFNTDGTILSANKNFQTLFDYELSELQGQHHRMLISKKVSQEPRYSEFWENMKLGNIKSGEYEYFTKSGASVWLNVSYTPVKDGNGNVFKIVNIASDVTEAKHARETSNAEIERHSKEQEHVVEVLASSLKALSNGDLKSQITEVFSGEYEQLRGDFNATVQNLNATMQGILTNAMGMQNGAGEISQSSDDLAKRTENSAAALEETAAALDEITATVQQTAQSAEQANKVVAATRADAETSGSVVREAVNAMGEIKNSSNEIEKIIGVIDEIAFQTNLLALNAGVEAARAGEAGRGFAVVASEVRALAQRSTEAAKDIKDLISASGKHVETGVQLVGKTGTSLENIVTRVAEVTSLVSNISSSTQEQATALSEVNGAINDMDRVTQQNAAMVEESTAAAHSLTNDSQELTRMVQKFDLGGASVAAVTPVKSASVSKPPVAAQQERAAAYFASGSLALDVNTAEDNDWKDF